MDWNFQRGRPRHGNARGEKFNIRKADGMFRKNIRRKVRCPYSVNAMYNEDVDRASDFGLGAALAEYINQHNSDTFWQTFNMEKVTWEDVSEELEKVEAIYQDKGAGNPIRRAFRGSTAYTNTATHFLEAIPNDDGLGLLKGALLVVLKVRFSTVLSGDYGPRN